MKMTLQAGLTAQRHLHRRMARWITPVEGYWGGARRWRSQLPFLFSFFFLSSSTHPRLINQYPKSSFFLLDFRIQFFLQQNEQRENAGIILVTGSNRGLSELEPLAQLALYLAYVN